jgi:hypothetical protein
MVSKSQITRALVPLLMISMPGPDISAEILRLRNTPFHDRTKRGGKGKGSKKYKASTNKFIPHQGVKECTRRLAQRAKAQS